MSLVATPPFKIVIPARFASTRLPGKPLVDVLGKPLIQWVYERAMQSGAESVLIAADDERIVLAAEQFGATVCMTDPRHESGTDRIAEAVSVMKYPNDSIIVGLQVDEPLIPISNLRQVARGVANHPEATLVTLRQSIEAVEELFNPNCVKVVTDEQQWALYFSRAAVPWNRDIPVAHQATDFRCDLHYQHIGLYAYRAEFLRRYVSWGPAPLERTERLEQLRVLWHGERIYVPVAEERPPFDVDTPADLTQLRELLASKES